MMIDDSCCLPLRSSLSDLRDDDDPPLVCPSSNSRNPGTRIIQTRAEAGPTAGSRSTKIVSTRPTAKYTRRAALEFGLSPSPPCKRSSSVPSPARHLGPEPGTPVSEGNEKQKKLRCHAGRCSAFQKTCSEWRARTKGEKMAQHKKRD